MFDLVIANGSLVHADRIETGSLGIRDGKIAAVVTDGEAIQGRAAINAAGKWVLPGLVDAHVHLREPGNTHKEDFESATKAAAAGGVTTIMVMPTDNPWTATAEEFERKRALGEGRAHVDYAVQVAVGPSTTSLDAIARLGPVSYELFLVGGKP